MLWSFSNPKEKRSKIIGCSLDSFRIDNAPEESKSITRNTVPLSSEISVTSELSIWINPFDDEISPTSAIVIDDPVSDPK